MSCIINLSIYFLYDMLTKIDFSKEPCRETPRHKGVLMMLIFKRDMSRDTETQGRSNDVAVRTLSRLNTTLKKTVRRNRRLILKCRNFVNVITKKNQVREHV